MHAYIHTDIHTHTHNTSTHISPRHRSKQCRRRHLQYTGLGFSQTKGQGQRDPQAAPAQVAIVVRRHLLKLLRTFFRLAPTQTRAPRESHRSRSHPPLDSIIRLLLPRYGPTLSTPPPADDHCSHHSPPSTLTSSLSVCRDTPPHSQLTTSAAPSLLPPPDRLHSA
jgi:hypothetical protein